MRPDLNDDLEQDCPHAKTADQVLVDQNSSSKQGLSQKEVSLRRAKYGPNQLKTRKPKSTFRILIDQFESPVVWLLIAAATVAFVFGEWKEGSAVFLVLAINATIGFVTEQRAIRSMEALRQLGSLKTRVRREGKAELLPAEELVPGDIVLLEGGDILTADLRLVEASNLSADESALTGESLATSKGITPVAPNSILGDRSSMVFKGTSITRGSGIGVIVATGMQTELGTISRLVEEAVAEHSPLERQLQRLSGQLIWLTVIIVTMIGLIGVYAGRDHLLMIQSAIALAVAAIPEGLPIVATMALARGMWRMAKQNALVERLSAVETLGATTIIFTDKTGTLTENSMYLREIYLADGLFEIDQNKKQFQQQAAALSTQMNTDLNDTLTAMVLCNNAELGSNADHHTGDPLEIALLRAASLAGKNKPDLMQQFSKVGETAFDSDSKMMASVHNSGDDFLVCVKGAPEAVLEHVTHIMEAGASVKLNRKAHQIWLSRTNEMAARGMKVLAVAKKHTTNSMDPAYAKLTILALLGLMDPPRFDVPEAIANCHQAGIRVIMLTGDHAVTAKSIADSIGLAKGPISVVEGSQLKPSTEMTDAELSAIRETDVFARVNPSQKLDLVSLHQRAGEIVAMTGDGVNDAPALKKADIGIAMGMRGTQVAREAAAMVLQDDAFVTIIAAIREGRVIFRNIQRFVTYLLSCNLSEVLVVGSAILLGLPLPLLPLQILFLNLVTDIFPAFALGLGEEDGNVLNIPPRDPKKPIITRSMWMGMVVHSISITVSTLIALAVAHYVLLADREEATTVSFLTLALAQLLHVFNMRDPRSKLLDNTITRNKFVWGAIALSLALILLALFMPVFAEVLHLHAPTADMWLLIMVMSVVPLALGEVGKTIAASPHRRSSLSNRQSS